MSRTSRCVLKENALRMLDLMQEASVRSRERVAPLSYRHMASSLGLSIQQVRFLCGKLEADGDIVAIKRFAPDGGQLANGYALTARGRAMLRQARKGEAVL